MDGGDWRGGGGIVVTAAQSAAGDMSSDALGRGWVSCRKTTAFSFFICLTNSVLSLVSVRSIRSLKGLGTQRIGAYHP